MGQMQEIDYGGMTLLVKGIKIANQPGEVGVDAEKSLVTRDANGNNVVTSGTTITSPINTLTAVNGIATSNEYTFKITTEVLNTAAAGSTSLLINKSGVTSNDLVLVSRSGGTNRGGIPVIAANTTLDAVAIAIRNAHATDAFNGTLSFHVWVIKAT